MIALVLEANHRLGVFVLLAAGALEKPSFWESFSL